MIGLAFARVCTSMLSELYVVSGRSAQHSGLRALTQITDALAGRSLAETSAGGHEAQGTAGLLTDASDRQRRRLV